MKQNTINTAQKLKLLSSLVITFLLLSNYCFTQELRKNYKAELSIKSNTEITIIGPGDIPFISNGKLRINTSKGYSLEPRDNDGVASFVVEDLNIETSNDNFIKQVVSVSIIPDEKAKNDAQRLIEALKISLKSTANNTITINNNLNISKLEFTNGFFSGTKNMIILKNGNSYRVKSLKIQVNLYIPVNSNLSLKSKYININIEDLNGRLRLETDNGTINGGNVKELIADLNFTKATFKNIEKAEVNAYNSEFTANQIGKMEVGTKSKQPNKGLFEKSSSSSLSKYNINTVSELNITETTSDEFTIKKLGQLSSNKSRFSNYIIDEISKGIKLNAKNGDLTVKSISNGFSSIEVNNHISTIQLGVKGINNYKISFPKLIYTENIIPVKAKKQSNNTIQTYLLGDENKAGIISITCDSCKVEITD